MLIPLGLLLLSYVFYEKKYFRNTLIVFFALITLSMILFRYGVGTDYFAYKDIYYSMTKTNFTITKIGYPTLEPGFVFLNLLAKNLNISYQVFISILSIIMFSSYMNFQKNFLTGRSFILSTSLYFSLFFIVWTLSAFRQGLALGILLFTVFNHKLNLKLSRKIVITLLVSMIHTSSLIVFAYFILNKLFKSKKSIYALIGVSVIVSIGIVILTPFLLNIEFFRNITYINKILYYFKNSSISYSALLIRLIMLTYLLYFYDWFEESTSEMFFIYRYVLIGIAIYISLAQAPIAASRLTIYSYIFLPIVLTHSVDYLKTKEFRIGENFSKKIGLLAILVIFVFDVTFLAKEAKSFSAQAKYEGNILTSGYPTLFNKKPEDFKTLFGLNELVRRKADALYSEYFTVFGSTDKYEYKEGDSFIAVPTYVNNETTKGTRYGIINQNGSFVIAPTYQSKPEIYGILYGGYFLYDNISRYQYSAIDSQFKEDITEYINYRKSIQTNIELQEVIELTPEIVPLETIKGIEELLHTLEIKDYEIISESIYSVPKVYSKVVVNIYKSSYVVVLDGSKKVVSQTLYDSIGNYDANGFLYSFTNDYTHIYNLDGNLIWVSK